jgi:hypothetical protein
MQYVNIKIFERLLVNSKLYAKYHTKLKLLLKKTINKKNC